LVHTDTDALGAIPPPFAPFETFYIVPRSFKADLEALALNTVESKTDASPTDLQLDLTSLVENTDGEEVHVIQTNEAADGTRKLVATSKKERFWTLKDGLSEDDDFLFVHATGWTKMTEW
jgi:hypothetical protein